MCPAVADGCPLLVISIFTRMSHVSQCKKGFAPIRELCTDFLPLINQWWMNRTRLHEPIGLRAKKGHDVWSHVQTSNTESIHVRCVSGRLRQLSVSMGYQRLGYMARNWRAQFQGRLGQGRPYQSSQTINDFAHDRWHTEVASSYARSQWAVGPNEWIYATTICQPRTS